MPRVFEVVTAEYHPITGDLILDEDGIKAALAHKTIKEWAYIKHDKDVYTQMEEDECRRSLSAFWSDNRANLEESESEFINKNLNIAGSPKPAHWHIVIRTDRNEDTYTIAKWFGVSQNFIDIPKGGRDTFLDKVEYLTHEDEKQQALGKHLYPDEEVKANFDFRNEINSRLALWDKYGSKKLSAGQKLMMHVLNDGWSMRRCRQEDPLNYASVRNKLPPLRLDYLADQPPVPLRLTIYVDGKGGIGKTSFCRAIAETLFKDAEQAYFSIGNDERVSFDGYDGEPCVIWNDMRVTDFISRFSPQGTYKIFDTHPSNEAQQAKHTRVILSNCLNIINGVQPYAEFIEGLAGTYKSRDGQQHKAEDETQAWRRFPMILCVRENDFDILLNRGFIDKDLSSIKTMILYNNVRGSLKTAMEHLGGKAKEIVIGNMTKPVIDAYHYIEDSHDKKISEVEDLSEEFKHYGESIPDEERYAQLFENYSEWKEKKIKEYDENHLPPEQIEHYTFDWWIKHVFKSVLH